MSRLGDDKEAGGVFVNAVNKAYLGIVDVKSGIVLEMPGDGIDQSAGIVAHSWVYYESGGLVDDDDVLVFVDNVEWDILGLNLGLIGRVFEPYGDAVKWLDAVVALDGSVVDAYKSRLGSLLDAVARGVLQMEEEKLVHA